MVRTLFALIGIAGAIGLFFLYTKPAYDSVEALRMENESYDLALEKAAELQRLRQSLLSRYNAFNPADIERLHKLLPDHVDNVRLVLDLDTLASRHGVALQNVVISRPNTSTEGRSNVIGPTQRNYESLTLQFSTTGTYEQFKTFLIDLEDSLRIVDVVDLSIDPLSTQGGDLTYSFDIILRTYWLK
ncbi:MAG TPA: type 4a pilus biogenesis protein PilO [Candidatus Paceibacterota bacterium]|nr:type 4a pilus biogenesis protein PilO [Candidatus Paceibacterota bacterium]